jgi:hypothetical protein
MLKVRLGGCCSRDRVSPFPDRASSASPARDRSTDYGAVKAAHSERVCYEVMKDEAAHVGVNASVADIAARMRDERAGFLPICDEQ